MAAEFNLVNSDLELLSKDPSKSFATEITPQLLVNYLFPNAEGGRYAFYSSLNKAVHSKPHVSMKILERISEDPKVLADFINKLLDILRLGIDDSTREALEVFMNGFSVANENLQDLIVNALGIENFLEIAYRFRDTYYVKRFFCYENSILRKRITELKELKYIYYCLQCFGLNIWLGNSNIARSGDKSIELLLNFLHRYASADLSNLTPYFLSLKEMLQEMPRSIFIYKMIVSCLKVTGLLDNETVLRYVEISQERLPSSFAWHQLLLALGCFAQLPDASGPRLAKLLCENDGALLHLWHEEIFPHLQNYLGNVRKKTAYLLPLIEKLADSSESLEKVIKTDKSIAHSSSRNHPFTVAILAQCDEFKEDGNDLNLNILKAICKVLTPSDLIATINSFYFPYFLWSSVKNPKCLQVLCETLGLAGILQGFSIGYHNEYYTLGTFIESACKNDSSRRIVCGMFGLETIREALKMWPSLIEKRKYISQMEPDKRFNRDTPPHVFFALYLSERQLQIESLYLIRKIFLTSLKKDDFLSQLKLNVVGYVIEYHRIESNNMKFLMEFAQETYEETAVETYLKKLIALLTKRFNLFKRYKENPLVTDCYTGIVERMHTHYGDVPLVKDYLLQHISVFPMQPPLQNNKVTAYYDSMLGLCRSSSVDTHTPLYFPPAPGVPQTSSIQ